MVFDDPSPGVLAWRYRPWIAWAFAGMLFVAVLFLALAIKVRWRMDCRRAPLPGATAVAGGACRVDQGTLLWTTGTDVALAQIVGAQVEHRRDRDSDGRWHDEYRPSLTCVDGAVPLDDWSRSWSSADERVRAVSAFLASDAAEYSFDQDHRPWMGVFVGLLLVAILPLLLFPRSASCTFDRRAGTVEVVHHKLIGAERTVRPLADLRGVWIFEVEPDSGKNRYRLGATDAEGKRLFLVRKPARRDVLEASVRDLRRFLGFATEGDLELPRPDLAPQARRIEVGPPPPPLS